ncbi:hypothetical protein ACXIUT_15270 [Achromobacter denitrificans]
MSEKNEWKLVPATMTQDMCVAFAEAWFSKVRCIDDPEMQDAYAAMLAAAPSAPGDAQDDETQAILRWIMRTAESEKEDCGMDPETPAAIRNGRLAAIASAAAQALGLHGGPSYQVPAAGDALPTIKGAAITGGYVVVTPAGWGEDKAQKVRDAILRLFPVNPAYTPKPEDAQVPQQGEA